MPPQKGSSLWDNAEFLSDVIIGLYEAGTISKGLSPKMRDGLVQYLNNCGHTVTWEGIRQHVQKLRKTKDISSIQNAGGVDTPTKGTPSKATPRKGASAKKAAGKSSRKRVNSDDSDIDDDDFKKEEGLSDVEKSPSKKPVKRVKKEPSPDLDEYQA
ncbi:unnamed protein product [Clonostachys solani]|uniref:Uncharacterized protein n=1 Tax=Clonostachys solani TaxID=160281 RepID=A0A9N9YWE3_9HYPO|nr:unnamed protein product [Clonostachys solani]